ncbi:MAG: TRAP transporter large permease [Tropicimonas sp.]|uniref:TRAP transporter large permease n=1 Tax=Tropicimonas sp. TaxID=2067044 RepID=UPI003A8AFD28
METAILIGLFLFFVLSGMPIAIAIAVTVLGFVTIFPVGTISFFYQNMYSSLNSFPLLAVPFFILTGAIMETGGLSKRLVQVANALVGNMTSGLAVVAILTCMFFGAISGSAPATVAAISAIMIPYMVRYQYSKAFSASLISTAGGLGIIIPPSIPLIIYGIVTSTSIGDLFLAGIGPGLLVGACLIVMAIIVGGRRGYKGTGEERTLKSVGSAIWEAKWALALPVIILGGIYGGIFTPTEASVVGVFYGLFVGFFIYRELEIKQLVRILTDGGAIFGTIFLLFGFAVSLAFLVAIIQLPTQIQEMMSAISSNKYVILLIINLFLLLVGMLIDPMSANLIFSPILLQVVTPLGVDPVHFGIVVTLNLALGFVTPPLAANIFLSSTLTGVPVPALIRESLPFVAAMMVALLIVTFVPIIALFPLVLFK